MAVKVPSAKLRGPFKALADKLKVVEFDTVKYNRNTVGRLEPNMHYKAGKSGAGKPRYEYLTDDKGRIVAGYAEDLRLKPEGQKRGWHNPDSPDKLPGDDAGHIFGDQFDGSGGLDNIRSQLRDLNQGAYKDLESRWARALENNQKVEVMVVMDYADNGRPTRYTVESWIDDAYVFEQWDN